MEDAHCQIISQTTSELGVGTPSLGKAYAELGSNKTVIKLQYFQPTTVNDRLKAKDIEGSYIIVQTSTC